MREPRHGTINEYSNHGCRCDLCRAANAAYYREYAARKSVSDPCPDCGGYKRTVSKRCQACHFRAVAPSHGMERMYRNGCRCDLCRAASAKGRRERSRRSKERVTP